MATIPDDLPLVSIRDTEFWFGERHALRGVSLSIDRGEIYALLGPNGAGKTTLVRTLSGRVVPTAGTVTIDGRPPATSRRARADIGLVPQQIALYPTLTCKENLTAFARLMGVKGADVRARAREVLEGIGLADRAGDRASDLSGGMQRRLNIGAAVMHRPRLLVLDEPTVGVDLHAKETIHDLLLAYKEDGMAILLTTHDMDQAASIADRVGIIADGAIRAEGAPDELVANTFGAGKQIVIELPEPPADAARAYLSDLGLAPMRNGEIWTGRFDRGYDAVAQVDQKMRSIGSAPNEILIREPSLKSVFFETVGPDSALQEAPAERMEA